MATVTAALGANRSVQITVDTGGLPVQRITRVTPYSEQTAYLAVSVDTDGSFIGYDYEAPPDVGVRWRALFESPGNLLTTRAAEASSAADWSVNGGTAEVDTAAPYQGASCIRLTSDAAATNTAVSLDRVAVSPGDTVTASAVVRNGTSPNCEALFQFLDGAFAQVGTNVYFGSVSSGAWTSRQVTAVVPAGAVWARLLFYNRATAAGQTAFIDALGIWRGAGGEWAMPGTPIPYSSLSNAVTLPSEGRDWWVAVGDPLLTRPVTIESFPAVSRPLGHTLVQPLGARNPVPVVNARRGQRGVLTLLTLTLSELRAVRSMIEDAPLFLLNGPADRGFGDGTYWLAQDYSEERPFSVASRPERRLVVTVQEVDRPPLDVPVPPQNTWADWRDSPTSTWATWTQFTGAGLLTGTVP